MGDQTFGSTVRQRRDVLGLSQTRLAELVGRSASTVRNWERDRATPSAPHDVVALAAILGIDESHLLEQAGFEPTEVETSPTMEQALASLVDDAGITYPAAEEPSFQTQQEPPSRPLPDSDPGEVTESAEPVAVTEPVEEDREPGDAPGATEVAKDAAGEAVEPEPQTEPEDPMAPEAQRTAPVVPPRPWAAESFAFRDGQTQAEENQGVEGDSEEMEEGKRFAAAIREVFDAGVPPADEWSPPDPDMPRAERRRRASRAAPPTVLESAPVGEPSYLEDPDERQRYRVRALVTTAIVVVLVILFLWAFDRTTDAMGDLWQQFVDMLSI